MKLVNICVLAEEDYEIIKQAGVKPETYAATEFVCSLLEAGLEFLAKELRLENFVFQSYTNAKTNQQVLEVVVEIDDTQDVEVILKSLRELNDDKKWEVHDV